MSTAPCYIKTKEQTPYLQPFVFLLRLVKGRTSPPLIGVSHTRDFIVCLFV